MASADPAAAEMAHEEEEEEEAEEEMLEDVLHDVALIEAALAARNSSLALDEIDIVIDEGGSGQDSGVNTSPLDTIVAPPVRLRAGTPVDSLGLQEAAPFARVAEEPSPDAARWQPDPFAYPDERAWLRDRDGGVLGLYTNDLGGDDRPPAELLPMAAACVLLLLLSSWGQLRRSRRRVLERQEDAWRRDVDLVESAYRDQTPPNAVLR